MGNSRTSPRLSGFWQLCLISPDLSARHRWPGERLIISCGCFGPCGFCENLKISLSQSHQSGVTLLFVIDTKDYQIPV